MALLSSVPLSTSTLHPPENENTKADSLSSPFHPSMWGDYFISYSEDQMKIDEWTRKVHELKEEVKRMLSNAKGSIKEMVLIDELQRLGVAYHFEKEIDQCLQHIHDSNVDYQDLVTVALWFRLLRHEGYNISSDVFCKFKEEEGNFKGNLISDVRGLLNLYEAGFYGIQGEDILDEAIAFTRMSLTTVLGKLDGPLAEEVGHALELPIRKRMSRLDARFYISIFEQEKPNNDVILQLAKFDFNLLQSQHRRELKEVTRWWKEIGLAKTYSFARDRIVEGYLWILGVYFEPQYSRARGMIIKVFGITSIIDDIYDVRGTIEELELFTNAILRWDFEATNQLPEYMKHCYLAILHTVDEIEDELVPSEKFYRTDTLKNMMKEMANAYIKEAQWLSIKYVPTLEEYLEVALVTVGYLYLTCCSYVGMGKEATKEAFKWLETHPKFLLDSSIIARLADDIQSNEREQKTAHVASALECYVKDHGVSRQEACNKFQEMIAIAWKDMNQFCLKPTPFPMSLLMRVINFAGVIEVLYQYEDGYTHSSGETKNKVQAVLVDPVVI